MKKVILLSVLLLSVITLNAQKKETYRELANPVTTNPAQRAKVKTTQVSWGSTDSRYKKEEPAPISRIQKSMKLTAWKGEKVSAQFVVWSTQDVNHLSFVISDLRSSKSKITATGNIQTGFVRYVMTDELNKDGKGGCGYRNKADFDSTLVADPIDHHTHILPFRHALHRQDGLASAYHNKLKRHSMGCRRHLPHLPGRAYLHSL